MNKKYILGIIIVISFIIIALVLKFSLKTRYDKLVKTETEWNDIISSRNEDNLSLESIEFNDYNLIIDNENNIIYYSVVETKNKYNPTIKYKNNKLYLAFSSEISDQNLENSDIKLMIYNDTSYKIYSLYVTNYPILNFDYTKDENEKSKRIDTKITLFDNHTNNPRKMIISDGKLTIVSENEYIFSLTKESVGRNKRENNISIFELPKENEYVLKEASENDDKVIKLFINNKYVGLYTLSHKPERKGVNESKIQ